MKRKLLSLILAFVLCVSFAIPVKAMETPTIIPSITIYLESAGSNATLTNVYSRYIEDWYSAMFGTNDFSDAERIFYFAPNGTITFDKDVVIEYFTDARSPDSFPAYFLFQTTNTKTIRAGETVYLSDFPHSRYNTRDFPNAVTGDWLSIPTTTVYGIRIHNNNAFSESFHSPGRPGTIPYEGFLETYTFAQHLIRGLEVAAPISQPTNISVLVNNEAVVFDQPPISQGGRTLVPLRAIFEALGAEIEWNSATQTVTATADDVIVIMQIGSDTFTVNDEAKTLDVPSQIVGGRTLVPTRAVAESFGADVNWDASTETITITQ